MKATRTKGRACVGKMRHRTAGAAHRHLARLVRIGAAAGALDVYACPSCGWWHVGHRPGRKRAAA